MAVTVRAALLLAAALAGMAEPVTRIPGFDGELPFKSDAGYIDVDAAPHTKHMFYWLVGAENKAFDDADTVLWLTGGPGCSSLMAFLTEHGPFRIEEDGSLKINPYSWNKAGANVIYLEAPVGVGYSYADDGNYTTGDDETARVNLGVLRGFFEKFPQLRKNRLFITGESYAGHYVPQLASAVADHNAAAPAADALNLHGWMVGNPSWDWEDGSHYFDFMQYHSIIDRRDYAAALVTCNGTFSGDRTPQCAAAVAALRNQTIGINPYDVIGTCIGKPSLTGGCLTSQAATDARLTRAATVHASGERGLAQTFVPCINVTDTTDYFGRADVRAALHVSPKSNQWDVCSQVVHYEQYARTVAPIYTRLVPTHRVLVYSGDVDSCVPFPSTQDSVDQLGYPLARDGGWKPWHVDGQIAGFQRSYDAGKAGSLAWASVRGASHMVPNAKPAAAYALFDRYLRDGRPAL